MTVRADLRALPEVPACREAAGVAGVSSAGFAAHRQGHARGSSPAGSPRAGSGREGAAALPTRLIAVAVVAVCAWIMWPSIVGATPPPTQPLIPPDGGCRIGIWPNCQPPTGNLPATGLSDTVWYLIGLGCLFIVLGVFTWHQNRSGR